MPCPPFQDLIDRVNRLLVDKDISPKDAAFVLDSLEAECGAVAINLTPDYPVAGATVRDWYNPAIGEKHGCTPDQDYHFVWRVISEALRPQFDPNAKLAWISSGPVTETPLKEAWFEQAARTKAALRDLQQHAIAAEAVAEEKRAKMQERAALDVPAPAGDSPNKKATPKQRRPRERWLTEAMLLIQSDCSLSAREVARRVGVHHGTLSRSPEFQRAVELARDKKTDRPRGEKDGETRQIEAWDDD